MARLTASLKAIPLWLVFAVVAILAVVSYQPARELMTMQYAWIIVKKSAITVNLMLLLFLWGVTADRVTKNRARWKGWMLWGLGFAAIIVAYSVIGQYDTIFGL